MESWRLRRTAVTLLGVLIGLGLIYIGLLGAKATYERDDTSLLVQGAAGAGTWQSNFDLLSRVIAAEARGEPYIGKVAVGAVILNRVRHPEFPNTLAGVIYQPHAFESVTNGLIWRRTPTDEERRAALDALNGWDPTYGSIFFWNPSKPVTPWIWSRPIAVTYGNHVFAH